MNHVYKRNRYQAGSLTTEHRNRGADVYVFRWREPSERGKTKQFKVVLGTVKELTKTQAGKKADGVRRMAETQQPNGGDGALTVAKLVDHYEQRELGASCGKTAKVVKAYKYVFANYVVPKWGTLPLRAIKAIEVEYWLRSLDKANGTKAKIREVFGAAFRHAMRYELFPVNPIATVRQLRKGRSNLPYSSLPTSRRFYANWKAASRSEVPF